MTSEAYLLLFVAVCVSTNLVFGTALGGKVPAAVILMITSTTTVVLYLGFAYLEQGYFDPFFHIAAFVGASASAAIGAVTLWVMHRVKRMKGERKP